jgi:hypothetical protein
MMNGGMGIPPVSTKQIQRFGNYYNNILYVGYDKF